MNSKSITKYITGSIFAGVLFATVILVYILYVPGEDPSGKIITNHESTANKKARTDSQSINRQLAAETQNQIDTVYIYHQKEPIIVYSKAHPSSADSERSLAEKTSGEDGIGKEEEFKVSNRMEAFEQAFNKVIEQGKEAKEEQISENAESKNQSVDAGIMSEGMILDETQTRMGGTFFSYFYNHWQAPGDASNFMITITEKIMPSMGSSLSIKINEELVFQTRLQPRYDYIEQVGQQAVAICHQKLNQSGRNSEYFQVY